MGGGLGLTLALQLTTCAVFPSVYAIWLQYLDYRRWAYFAIVGIFLVARIPWIEKCGHDRLVTWHRKWGHGLYGIGAHVFLLSSHLPAKIRFRSIKIMLNTFEGCGLHSPVFLMILAV